MLSNIRVLVCTSTVRNTHLTYVYTIYLSKLMYLLNESRLASYHSYYGNYLLCVLAQQLRAIINEKWFSPKRRDKFKMLFVHLRRVNYECKMAAFTNVKCKFSNCKKNQKVFSFVIKIIGNHFENSIRTLCSVCIRKLRCTKWMNHSTPNNVDEVYNRYLYLVPTLTSLCCPIPDCYLKLFSWNSHLRSVIRNR